MFLKNNAPGPPRAVRGAEDTGLPVGRVNGTRPSGHNMPNVVSLPTTTMSGVAPAATSAATVRRLYASTAAARATGDIVAQAAGFTCFWGSAQSSLKCRLNVKSNPAALTRRPSATVRSSPAHRAIGASAE